MPKQKWENINKASTDNRDYRVIECNNGLVAALISDPKTDKAAVALTVQVGSAADPEELQGLAHFLEHMLFLGSEKFPAENEYKKFLIEHGGSANASTSIDKTTYYLTVSPNHLEGALDRFSQFFIKPLLAPDMTDREVNAVNMECERNRKVDRRRLMRLERWLSKVGHPYRKFSTGNKRLLDTEPRSLGINVRSELLHFHENWYSASIMKLAVIGKEPLDELEEKVSVFFSPIKDKNIEPYKFTDHPYGDQETAVIYYTTPIKNRRTLDLMFPCPDFTEHYASGPAVYVKYLIERTSKGTLYSLLRKHFWINSKIESNLQVISKGVAKYHVKFNLTEEGLNHYEEIVYAFFQYINMIRTQCIDESIWKECAEISKISFECKEKSPPHMLVLNLVESLTEEVPYEDVLVAIYKLTEWNPEIIKSLLDRINAKNVRIRLVSKKFEHSLREEDPIYGVRYKIEKIPQNKLERWDDGTSRVDFKINLDGSCANKMIPKNFELITPELPIRSKPEIIYESKYSRLWYMADHHYLLPKAFIRMNVYCAPTHVTPLMSVLACLMFSKMEDCAIEHNWDADSAGMASKLEKTRYGWQVSLSGYSDKISEYLMAWAKAMATLSFDREELNMRRDVLKRMLMNQEMETPTVKSDVILRFLTNETKWSTEELLDYVDSVTLEHMESLYDRSLTQSFVETFFYGNITKIEVQETWAQFKELVPRPYTVTPNQMREDRETIFPIGNLLYSKEEDVHTSSCTLVYFHLGQYSHELAAVTELFLQYIKEPVFSVLRTKEQLAYSVQRGVNRSAGCLGLYIRLLTEKHPRFTDDRIEKLLSVMGGCLTDKFDDDFIETHKQSLIDIKKIVPVKMSTKCEQIFAEIKSRRYEFDRNEKEIDIIQKLRKSHLVDFYEKYISSNAPMRRRLSVQILSNAGDHPTYVEDSQSLSYQEIKDITEFKNSCSLYPLTYIVHPKTPID